MTIVEFIIKLLMFLIPILINVAFVTLLERKILGFSQIRLGPTKVGFKGILQPFSDAIKLFLKQFETNFNSNNYMFTFSPIMMFFIMFSLWLVIPSFYNNNKFMLSMLMFIMILSVGVYPLLLSGWSSNSKYAVMGSLRGVAQTISYEISLALILMNLSILCFSLNLDSLKSSSQLLMMISPMLFLLWFVMMIAETNRTPFDFSEGESELVSGFNIEYASIGFVLIFLAEYASILLFSTLGVSLFLGMNIFELKSSLISILLTLIWIILRSTFPRHRYDMLMNMAWKSYLPQSLTILTITSMIIMM